MDNFHTVPDIPLGLGMALMYQNEARAFFEKLTNEEKTNIIKYIQTGNITGSDAKAKIKNTIENLRNHNIDFISVQI